MAVMDLSTYNGLQAALADYIDRSDMSERIPGWIALAEAQIARDLRNVSLRATTSIFGDTATLPSDVAELRSARLVTSSPHLDLPLVNATPEILAERRAGRVATGRPTHFTVNGNGMQFVPACDQAYTLEYTYFQKIIPLSNANQSNTVLVAGPDAYLFGALKEAETFLQNDERVALWEAKYNNAIASLERVRISQETGASLRPGRIARVF